MYPGGFQRGLVVVVWLLLLSAGGEGARANPYTQLAQGLFHNARQRSIVATASLAANRARASGPASRRFASSQEIGQARRAARQQYVAGMLPAMRPSAAIAHLPREHPVAVNPEQKWTKYYDLVKNRLRPRVEYAWSSNCTQACDTVTLSDEYVSLLRLNLDIVMWYRSELEAVAESQSSETAAHFKLFLDHIIAGLIDGLPRPPRISLSSGSVSRAKWHLDERQLREQIVMLYRYLLAKYQIYPEYEKFAAADLALMSAWIKISSLMGARLMEPMFDDLEVDLTKTNVKSMWKKPLSHALQVLQRHAEYGAISDSLLAEAPLNTVPTIIRIPPPAPKKSAPPAKVAQDDKTIVEIIVRQKR